MPIRKCSGALNSRQRFKGGSWSFWLWHPKILFALGVKVAKPELVALYEALVVATV
jgi:hypothetical protein